MAIQIDLKLEKQIINTYIPMDKLFDMLGIEYSLHSNMYCPFHENVHSPAAHLHTDSNRLWCYSEQRMYGSWDVYKVTLMSGVFSNCPIEEKHKPKFKSSYYL